ncbi:MAG: ABC transporter permease [Phascolarctobacterium sp.]|uniref:ABC transporter permease n=1 Tax=Phascolarctobacterium sp. TaxID=2049039 RepID=UPI0026DCC2E6|nr:ABC transporter permease [Phascolarctobacterium sp.]MDO4922378.1 ABC transporter permease [Phascolarctobacterium sp.]
MLKIFCGELRRAFIQELRGRGAVNKTLVLLLLGLPVVYTLLFGFTYQANVLNDIPVAACDLQQSKTSRLLINYYNTSDRFVVTDYVQTLEELHEKLRQGQVKAGIYVPADLDKRIKNGQQADVAMLIDGTNVVYGSAALVAAEEINMNILIGAGQRIGERLGLQPDQALETFYPAALRVRILNNPTNAYTNFMLLGLACNGVQISIYLYAADAFASLRRRRPHFCSALLAGKLLAIALTSLLGFGICLCLAHFVFAVPLRASWAAFALLGGAFILLFTSVGMLFSLAFGKAVLAIQNTLLFIMPGLLYSGLSWPNEWVSSLPGAIRLCFPMTYIALPLRDLSLQGVSGLLQENVLLMLAAAAALISLDVLLLRRKLRREAAV